MNPRRFPKSSSTEASSNLVGRCLQCGQRLANGPCYLLEATGLKVLHDTLFLFQALGPWPRHLQPQREHLSHDTEVNGAALGEPWVEQAGAGTKIVEYGMLHCSKVPIFSAAFTSHRA
jgi:hypothetical protein